MPREQQLSNTFETDLQIFSFKRSAKHGWSIVTAIHVSPGGSRRLNATLDKERQPTGASLRRETSSKIRDRERKMERRVASPVVRVSTAD
jgi:hypothetical protein